MKVGKFRDGIFRINMVLIISKTGWKWVCERKLAKEDKDNLAEVILCLRVLGRKRDAAVVEEC